MDIFHVIKLRKLHIALINKTVVKIGLRICSFILTAGIIMRDLRSKTS